MNTPNYLTTYLTPTPPPLSIHVGNILLNCHGQVKLADFGISKAVDGNKGYASSFVGTMTYMSPERIVGEAYGYPSDIW